jgi:formate hydrogenlyase transcriptional activator
MNAYVDTTAICVPPVLDIVRAAARRRDRAELCEEIAVALRGVLRCDRVAVVLPPSPELRDVRIADILRAGRAALVRREAEVACVMPLRLGGATLGMVACWASDRDAYRDLDLAIADRLGAAIAVAIDAHLAYERLERLRDAAVVENELLRDELRLQQACTCLLGDYPDFRTVTEQIRLVAPTDATVLVTGESGTGKDLAARAIHDTSPRCDHPFVTVDCAALPASLAESELFGHEQGAFTGAVRQRKGRFELASGGTVFLDEVGELPLELQAKLLRVLQERELERVGGTETIRVDVRIVAATNRDLLDLIARRRFREDLYYRLSVFPIALPPLRGRRADLPALAECIVDRVADRLHVPRKRIDPASMRRLLAHDWPGNVRELQNLIERALIVSTGELLVLEPATLPPLLAPSQRASRRHEVRRDVYREALEAANWVIEGDGGAAARLGVHPNTLRYRIKRLGLTRP